MKLINLAFLAAFAAIARAVNPVVVETYFDEACTQKAGEYLPALGGCRDIVQSPVSMIC